MGDKDKVRRPYFASTTEIIGEDDENEVGQRARAASVIPLIDHVGEQDPPQIVSTNRPSNATSQPAPLQIEKPSGLNWATLRKHRTSGLFSQDDLSIDVSLSPSQTKLQNGGVASSATTPVGSDFGKQHPMSIGAGSSIGSGSFDSDLNNLENRRQRYRPFRRKWRRFRRKYKGCIFAMLSSITSSLASYFVHALTVKKDADGKYKYSASYCLLWRFLGVLVPGIFIVLYYRFWNKEMVFDTVWPLKKKEEILRFCLSVARAVLDTVAILLNYQAFMYLLQSETSTILNSKPIVVQLLAHFTLGEEWGITPIVMSVVAVIGVVVMSKPPFLVPDTSAEARESENFVTDRLPGVLYAVASMFLSAIVYCILRYLKDVHYSVFSLFIGSAGVIFGLAMTFGLRQFVVPDDPTDFIYFITVASLVCFSSIAIVIALQNEEAFVVSLVRSCDVIFSFIWEIILDASYPDWYSGGGAFIIMFGVAVIFFRKYVSHQEPTSKVYKTFNFLTK